jgi:hypothetical protein
MKKTLIALAVATSLTALSGCGGSSSSDTTTDKQSQSVTLSGTAAKGIIQNGIVTATELSSTGAELGAVGTAITNDKGHYELILNDRYQGGVVKLTLTAGLDTKMKCDATEGCGDDAFGAAISLSEGFSLNAIVQPGANSQTVSVQITPFTHMATARALAKGGEINAASVAAAISEVNQIAGVNIMDNEIVDITSSESLANASDESKKLALFNAGLANLLVAGNNSVSDNIESNLAKLASSFEDGQFDANDSVKIKEITTAVATALTVVKKNDVINASLTNALADTQTAIDIITNSITDGVYNPEPSGSAGVSEVAKGKALLTNARTFIETIAADFEDPIDALAVDAETVGEVLDADSAIMAELLGDAIDQTLTDLDSKNLDFITLLDSSSTSYSTDITNSNNEKIGSITTTFSSDDTGIALTLNGTLQGERTVDITDMKLATNLTKDALTTSIDSQTNESLLDAISAQTAKVTLTGFIGNSSTSLTLNGVELSLSAIEVVTINTRERADNSSLKTKISAASFNGDMLIQSAGASFAGDAIIELVGFTNSASEVPLSLKKIAINGEFTSATKGSFAAGAKLIIDNASSFDTFGYFDYESTAYEYVSFPYTLSDSESADVSAAIAELTETNWGTSNYWLDYYGYDNSYSLNGYSLTGYTFPDLQAAIKTEAEAQFSTTPESISLEQFGYSVYGDYHQAWGNVKVTFPDFESADNFVKGTISVTAKANVPELPEATVIASISRTALAGGHASIVVSYSGQSFTLGVESEEIDATEPKATLTLSNPDGVKLIVNLAEKIDGKQYVVDGTVFVGQTQIGKVEETSKGIILVRYTDGTFETLY